MKKLFKNKTWWINFSIISIVVIIIAVLIYFIIDKRSYKDYNDKKITEKEIFTIEQPKYYVYFYMEDCSQCNSIKKTIFDYLDTHENLYIIDYKTTSIVVPSDGNYTGIGIDKLEDLHIFGTPSLFLLEDNITTGMYVGDIQINAALALA